MELSNARSLNKAISGHLSEVKLGNYDNAQLNRRVISLNLAVIFSLYTE